VLRVVAGVEAVVAVLLLLARCVQSVVSLVGVLWELNRSSPCTSPGDLVQGEMGSV
jgi:hypothetical protein